MRTFSICTAFLFGLLTSLGTTQAEPLSLERAFASVLGNCATSPEICEHFAAKMMCAKMDSICEPGCPDYSQKGCEAYKTLVSPDSETIAEAMCGAGMVQFCDCSQNPVQTACLPKAFGVGQPGPSPMILGERLSNGTSGSAGGSKGFVVIPINDTWATVSLPKICQVAQWPEGEIPDFCQPK